MINHKKRTKRNILRVGMITLITTLLLAPASTLFAQGLGNRIFLPMVTNLAGTTQNVEQNIELSTEQVEELDAFMASQESDDELSSLASNIGCVNPAYWYGYQYFQYIKRGDKGTNVWLAQYWLINRHNRSLAPYGADRDFGTTTYNAIREIQQYWKDKGYTACGQTIDVDGAVGRQTWAILAYKNTPPPSVGSGVLNLAQRKSLMVEMFKAKYGNDTATISLLLAMAAQESGRTLSNAPADLRQFCGCHNTDGIMQVTSASGYKSGNYDNTAAGVRRNIEDGIKVFEVWGGSSNRIVSAWKYNGGTYPFNTYARGQGDRHYIGNVANQLENFIAIQFPEYANSSLVAELRNAQNRINNGQNP